ncbi:MAG: branched-chain amino acid ABC transporter permease [candidate division NC10 bacterium]|nr:branched-chain amino acid ABC transporter permease [candidate division NC10 bacterium]
MQRLPWGLLALAAAGLLPFVGSRFYLYLGTDIAIMALFAVSLNLLLGYTGLVSFGQAAYFGIGAYACALLMMQASVPFILSLLAGGLLAGAAALLFGYFCIRLTQIYFAMLTLAFAQIVWAAAFKWNSLTGGDTGLTGVPFPAFLDSPARFYYFTLGVVGISLAFLRRVVGSPFGRMLMTIRENPERAEFIGVHVRWYELAAFVLAGFFSGVAGGLFGIFNHSVFPDFSYWTKSAEVLIMTILGGMYTFFGPAVGAGILLFLNMLVTSYTEYWPLVLGVILAALLFLFPGGVLGFLEAHLLRRGHREPRGT